MEAVAIGTECQGWAAEIFRVEWWVGGDWRGGIRMTSSFLGLGAGEWDHSLRGAEAIDLGVPTGP